MDEILASIRRIIESGEEKPVPALSATGAAGSDSSEARDADRREPILPSDRSSPLHRSTYAARIVPFSERAAPVVEPAVVEPAAEAGSQPEDRWLPFGEAANLAGEPGDSKAEPVVADEAVSAPSPLADPVEAADRWNRELDDIGTWPVLEEPVDPVVEPAPALELEQRASAEISAPVSAAAPADPDLPPNDAALHADDDDFVLDFNEADFVEALDRNAALVMPHGDAARSPPPSHEVPAGFPVFELPEHLKASSAFTGRASAPTTSVAGEPPAPAPAPDASVIGQAAAIMSDQAGAEVAAAFDDLARAIRDGHMKSMEDMAREMLRPMLQEWLDENLPRLVERLVREEIERVARGGRR